MARIYLTESAHASVFEACTESDKAKYHILGRLKAPFFDMNNATRNGRNYSEAAKAALDSDTFKEKFETRTMFGRLGHPMNDDEMNEDPAVRACVILSDYSLNKATNMYEGVLDIIDNQYGRQLKSLIDAGAVMGVSTRGSGDSYESGDEEFIRDYEFENLDVVTLPAVKAARVTVIESLDKSKHKKLEQLVSESEDKTMLQQLKVTVESSSMPNKKMLLESINKKLSGEVGTIESLVSDIAAISARLTEAESKLADAQAKLDAGTESEVTETIETDESKELESTNPAMDTKLKNLLRESTKLINSMKLQIVEQTKVLESYRRDSRSAKVKYGKLEASSSKLKVENDNLTKKCKSLIESVRKLTSANKELESKVNEANKSLTESTKKLTDNSKAINESLSKTNEQLETCKSKVKSLESANKSLKSENEYIKSKLVESIASAYGISLDSLKLKVTPNSTIAMIESAAKSIRDADDRVRLALPKVESLGKVVTGNKYEIVDDELDRAGRIAQLINNK